jgi:hypothetical protein
MLLQPFLIMNDFQEELPPVVEIEIRTGKSRFDWWRKGKAIDLWSIPHFLFGVLMGFLPHVTNISFFTGLALTVILGMLWEIYEKFVEIKETILNSIFDVVLPMGSFILTTEILRLYPYLQPADLWVLMGAVFIVYAFTNISGWLAYRRRNSAFWN